MPVFAILLLSACVKAFTLDDMRISTAEAFEILYSGGRFHDVLYLEFPEPITQEIKNEFLSLSQSAGVKHTDEELVLLRANWESMILVSDNAKVKLDSALQSLNRLYHEQDLQPVERAPPLVDEEPPRRRRFDLGVPAQRVVDIEVFGQQLPFMLYDLTELYEEGEDYIGHGLLDLGQRCLNISLFLACHFYDIYKERNQ